MADIYADGETAAYRQDTNAMSKKSPRVSFRLERIVEGDWRVIAECEGSEPRYIGGFKTKAEIDEWLAGHRRVDWLRAQGYAK